LVIAALALNRLINAQTGELVEMVPVRDLPQLMRAGAIGLRGVPARGPQSLGRQHETTRRDPARCAY
jgi:hypothetical protein